MSTLTFKGEAWTLRTAPSHKVLGATENGVEVLGYFYIDEPEEARMIMEIFHDEYDSEYKSILAVNCNHDDRVNVVSEVKSA